MALAPALGLATCTRSGIMEELQRCEKKLLACRAKAEKQRAAETQRLEQVLARHKELEEGHRRRLAAARAEHEAGARGAAKKAGEDILEAGRLEAEAEERARTAARRVQELAAEARELERQLFEANCALDAQETGSDERYQRMRSDADATVNRKLEESREVVRDAALYSAEVQDATLKAIVDMQEELRWHVKQADRQSEQRSRLKDLQETLMVMKDRASRDLSAQEFHQAKSLILQAWLDDWVSTTHVRTPSTTLPSPSPGLLKPLSPGRPRSVDRARRLAEGLSPPELADRADAGELRPQTAPG